MNPISPQPTKPRIIQEQLRESKVKSQESKVRKLKVISPSKVVSVAQDLIGTPYKFQGRVPGVGCDCIGLVILTAWELGLFTFDFRNYSRNPGDILEQEVNKHCQPLPELIEGALVLFKIDRVPQHCGIITNYRNDWGLIHAYENVGQVREHRLIKWWKDKIVGIYTLPNVEYV